MFFVVKFYNRKGEKLVRKYMLIFLFLITLLCSCEEIDYDYYFSDTGEVPCAEDTSGQRYIMSAYGSTYHLESCYIVKNMKEENVRVFYNKQFFIDREISPCKRCKP